MPMGPFMIRIHSVLQHSASWLLLKAIMTMGAELLQERTITSGIVRTVDGGQSTIQA